MRGARYIYLRNSKIMTRGILLNDLIQVGEKKKYKSTKYIYNQD